jgi:hypothetical protein
MISYQLYPRTANPESKCPLLYDAHPSRLLVEVEFSAIDSLALNIDITNGACVRATLVLVTRLNSINSCSSRTVSSDFILLDIGSTSGEKEGVGGVSARLGFVGADRKCAICPNFSR